MVADTLEQASRLTADELASLAGPQEGLCLSIYLPTHRAGKEIRQDPVRLKNRLTEAESKLESLNDSSFREVLEELRERCNLDNEAHQEFWRHQEDGLAILIAGGMTRMLQLSVETPEETVVDHRFYVRPLIKAVGRDGEYGVVAVSRGGVRFLEGSKRGLSEKKVADLPESLQAVVGGGDQKGFNLHSFQNAGRANGEKAVPHGHVDKDEFEALKRYFGEIAEAVGEALRDDPRPIVFAGVDELFPYFKEACEETSLDLITQQVSGNPDEMSADDLHEHSWPLACERLAKRTDSLIAELKEQLHSGMASTDLKEIVKAAKNGRVESLLIASNCRPLGSYDPTQQRVELAEAERDEGVDLADLAAAATLNSSGQVIVLEPSKIDFAEDGIAAAFRYTHDSDGRS